MPFLVQGVYRCSFTRLEQILLSKSSLITSLARCVPVPPLSAPEHRTVTLIVLPYLSRRPLAYYYYFSTALNLKPSRQSTPLPEQLASGPDSQGTRRDPGSRGTGLVHLLLISDCTTTYPRSQNKIYSYPFAAWLSRMVPSRRDGGPSPFLGGKTHFHMRSLLHIPVHRTSTGPNLMFNG